MAFKGFAEGQGYTHAELGSLRWACQDTETELSGFMVWMSRLGLQHIMCMPLAEMVPKVPLPKAPKPRIINVESQTLAQLTNPAELISKSMLGQTMDALKWQPLSHLLQCMANTV